VGCPAAVAAAPVLAAQKTALLQQLLLPLSGSQSLEQAQSKQYAAQTRISIMPSMGCQQKLWITNGTFCPPNP
jgi:hypothetical protein